MGTTCMARPPEGRKAFLDKMMGECPKKYRLVDSVLIGAAYYAAQEITDPDDATEPYVVGVIFRAELHGADFCYKGLDESMGPGSHLQACPPKILRVLTPIDRLVKLGVYGPQSALHAKGWRDACWARAKRKPLVAGDRIRLPRQVAFCNGVKADTFTKVHVAGRRNLFRADGHPGLVRLRHEDVACATRLERA